MKKLLLQACILFSVLSALGQSDSLLLDQSFNGMRFPEFLQQVEVRYDVKIFSNSEKSDSLIVKQEAVPAYLCDVLKATFSDTKFSYYPYSRQTLFVLNDYEIYDLLPRYFTLDILQAPEPKQKIEFLAEEKEIKKVKKSQFVSFGTPMKNAGGRTAVLSGRITDDATGEGVIGAVLIPEGLTIGTAADLDGYFNLELPMGKYSIVVKSLGKEDQKVNVSLYGDGKVNVEMREQTTQLKGVNIIGDRVHNVQGIQVGLETMEIKAVKQLPSAMGEVDIVKAAIMLPGVQTVGEGASGFNVRGGSVDQNLILLDGAPIFNSSHLFGFFSVFNQDVVDEFMLYKSGIPADYGGRVSSVLSVTTRNGKKKEHSGLLGISPITARGYYEGPLIKNKTSLLFAARTTYSDWLLKRLDDPRLSNSAASFWDSNLKINHKINDNNSLKISSYRSNDYFRLDSDTTFRYANTTLSADWHHVFNQNLKLDNAVAGSFYEYQVESEASPAEAFMMDYSIRYGSFNSTLRYSPTVNNKLSTGIQIAQYSLKPSRIHPVGETSNINEGKAFQENAIDATVFVGDEWHVTEKLLVYGGLRANMFMATGERTVYEYVDGLPLSDGTRIDSTVYSKGDIAKQYLNIEPRVSVRLKLGANNSIKASYNRMVQNLHMMSNSAAVSPTDTWTISGEHIKPQTGDVYSMGYYQNFKDNILEASVEIYYKDVSNVIDYKGGARLLLNETLETDIIQGKQQAYGIELLLKKKFGALTGWIGYTYSVSKMLMDSKHKEERINNGTWYPSNHDKPHDITFVSNYKFNRRISFSNNVTYSTGRPITYPVAKYQFKERPLLHYSDRNEYRVPNYFRWDISINVEGNLKSKKIAHSYWSFSVYNLTGRDNVYSIFFKTNDYGKMQGYQMSIFPQPMLTIAYNIKF